MLNRAAAIFCILLIFYLFVPYAYGTISTSLLISALFFSLATFLCGAFLLSGTRIDGWAPSDAWQRTILLLFWVSNFGVLMAIASILQKSGLGIASLGRADLFLLREQSLNSLKVISINISIVTAGLLSLRDSRYLGGLSLPVIFEVLTQSRSFILSAALVIFICRRVSWRESFGFLIVIVGVTLLRIEESLEYQSMFLYMVAESLNTSLGSLMMTEEDYSVTLLQGVRVLLAAFPFAGTLVPIQSEALLYNEVIERTYGHYGLAFGIVGFSKFSTPSVMIASVMAAVAVFYFLLRLRLPDILMLIVFVVALPSFFRWSPAEYFFVVARVSAIVLCTHHALRLFRILISFSDSERAQFDK